jgi:hypothetical protein
MEMFVRRTHFVSGYVKVFIIDESLGIRYSLSYSGPKTITRDILYKDNPRPVEPFIEIEGDVFDDFVKKIIDYASKNGIKGESENLLREKYEAAVKHLDDIRRVVFKDHEHGR